MKQIELSSKLTWPLIVQKRDELLRRIDGHEAELRELMATYQSSETSDDELFKTRDCLTNLEIEKSYIRAHTGQMASMIPVNLMLYSLILFGVIPSLMCERMIVRPPTAMIDVISRIYALLNIAELFPGLVITAGMERQAFTEQVILKSNAVLFTGTHRNASKIHGRMNRKQLFLYNGAGINPLIVFKDADLDLAVKKSAEVKLFNSGQDCAGPDAIFVHADIATTFIDKLIAEIRPVVVGDDYSDPATRVGPLIENTQMPLLSKILCDNQTFIKYGGSIDYMHNRVQPTIIAKRIRDGVNYDELFAPIFFVSIFDENSFGDYFLSEKYTNFAMYASLFGSSSYCENMIKDTVLLHDDIIIESERGNKEYGGYGYYASYLQFGGKKTPQPTLISRDLAACFPAKAYVTKSA